jgi:hypothetical protein
VDFDSHSPRSQRDRTGREDRRLNFYELRDNLSGGPTRGNIRGNTRSSITSGVSRSADDVDVLNA